MQQYALCEFKRHKPRSDTGRLPEVHNLFLTYLDRPEDISFSIRPTTVGNWIKAEMETPIMYRCQLFLGTFLHIENMKQSKGFVKKNM